MKVRQTAKGAEEGQIEVAATAATNYTKGRHETKPQVSKWHTAMASVELPWTEHAGISQHIEWQHTNFFSGTICGTFPAPQSISLADLQTKFPIQTPKHEAKENMFEATIQVLNKSGEMSRP